MQKLNILDVVAVLEDIPNENIQRGQVGTLVEKLSDDVFEVEFSDDNGIVYAQITVHANQLLHLHHAPMSNEASSSTKRNFAL